MPIHRCTLGLSRHGDPAMCDEGDVCASSSIIWTLWCHERESFLTSNTAYFVIINLSEKLRCPKYHAAHADLIQQRESDHSCAFARAPKSPSALFSSLIYIKAQFGQKGGRTVYLRRAPRQINFFPSCIALYQTNLKNIAFTEALCTFHGFCTFSTKTHKKTSSKLDLECT